VAGERCRAAQYEQLYPDARFLKASLPDLAPQHRPARRTGRPGQLLPKEQSASDLPGHRVQPNGQAGRLAGLQAIGTSDRRRETHGRSRTRAAERLHGFGQRSAASQRKLPDGRFRPVRLQDREAPSKT